MEINYRKGLTSSPSVQLIVHGGIATVAEFRRVEPTETWRTVLTAVKRRFETTDHIKIAQCVEQYGKTYSRL
jgi:hypothetical protein